MKKKLCYVLLLLFILFPLNIFAEKSIDIKNVDEVKQYYINLVPKIEGINKQESESIITEINKCQTPSLVKGCVEDYVFKDIDKIKEYEVVKSNKKFSECKEIFDILEYALTEDVKAVEEMEKMDLLTLDYVNGKIKLFNQIYKEFVEKYNKYKKAGLNNAPLIIDNLKNGEYVVDLSIYNDITGQMLGRRLPEPKLSMMDDAVYKLGKIVVKDGKKELIIKMIPLHQKLSGLHFSGYLLNLKVKDKHEKFNPASVDSRYEDYEDSLLKEFRKDANERYPKVIRLPLDNMETKTWEMYRDFKTKKNIEKYKELYNKKYTDAKSIQVRVFVPIMEHIQKDMGDQFAKPTIFTNSIEKYNPGNRDTLKNKIATVNINKYKDNSNKDKVDELKKILEKAKVASDSFILTDEEVQEYINKIDNLVKLLGNDASKPSPETKIDYKKLPDGEYRVIAEIRHASKQGALSMADGALVKENTKVIVSKGKYYLQIEMKALEADLNGTKFKGYLGDLLYINGEKYTQSEIINYHDDKDDYFEILKNYYKRKYSLNDKELDNLKYPKTLRYPIDIPTSEIQETNVKVFVPVMEGLSSGLGTKDAKPTILWDTLNYNLDKVKIFGKERINKIENLENKDEIIKAIDNASDIKMVFKILNDLKVPNFGNADKPNNTNNDSNSSNISELRGTLKDALNLANAVSASKGADSFLTIAITNATNVLANPKASASEIRSAINNLNTASARNNPTGSANNNANQNNGNNPFNNNSWGNNNNSWGNNSSWGNGNNGNNPFHNNSSWGGNSQWGGNNNQNSGPVTIQYEVPVEALNAYQSGVYSMANNAINHTARVEERNGQFRYSVQFVPMQREFGGKIFTGHLYNFFVYDGNKYQAQQSQGNVWSWVMNGKYDKVKGAVWVDAMDEIAGKGPGGGEQDVILSFNWNNAKEVGRVGGNNNQQNQNQNQQNQNQLNGQNQNNQASSQGFTDINGHWAKKAIDYVVGKKYFAGLSKTEFGPNKAITRGQFVTVLGRMLNVDKSQYQSQKFSDVKADAYYGPYIAWASQKGIVAGLGGNNFAPDQELTREQMALIMSKFLKVSGKNLKVKGNVKDFKDQGQISSWAKDSINEMLKLGVVNGMDDGTFAPKQAFTRAQVAQVLYNIDHN